MCACLFIVFYKPLSHNFPLHLVRITAWANGIALGEDLYKYTSI